MRLEPLHRAYRGVLPSGWNMRWTFLAFTASGLRGKSRSIGKKKAEGDLPPQGTKRSAEERGERWNSSRKTRPSTTSPFGNLRPVETGLIHGIHLETQTSLILKDEESAGRQPGSTSGSNQIAMGRKCVLGLVEEAHGLPCLGQSLQLSSEGTTSERAKTF